MKEINVTTGRLTTWSKDTSGLVSSVCQKIVDYNGSVFSVCLLHVHVLAFVPNKPACTKEELNVIAQHLYTILVFDISLYYRDARKLHLRQGRV